LQDGVKLKTSSANQYNISANDTDCYMTSFNQSTLLPHSHTIIRLSQISLTDIFAKTYFLPCLFINIANCSGQRWINAALWLAE